MLDGTAGVPDTFRYWPKIVAVGFAMGVAPSLAMSYQFGTNWGWSSDVAGPVVELAKLAAMAGDGRCWPDAARGHSPS